MAISARPVWRSFRRQGLPVRLVVLLIEAIFYLLIAEFCTRFLPFRWIAAWSSRPVRVGAGGEQPAVLAETGWAVAAAAKRVPWRAVCLQQALAGQAMLRRRKIQTVIHYGVMRSSDNELKAHAWLTAGIFPVLGTEALDDFVPIAKFPAH